MTSVPYINQLRAAKRRLITYCKQSGKKTGGEKHAELIDFYCQERNITIPNGKNKKAFLVDLYMSGEMGDIKLESKAKPNKRRQEYNEYLNSAKWKEFRELAFSHYGKRCYLCNSIKDIHLHHRTYINLFNESLNDVTPLCEKCHKKHHHRL